VRTIWFRAAGSLAFLGLVPACATASGPRPVFADGEAVPAAEGVWHSTEKGWILEIGEDEITRWQVTPAGCYLTPQPDDTTPLMGQVDYQLFTPAPNGSSARFQYLPGDAAAYFERLDQLPKDCGAADLTSEAAVFEVFASVMEEHYGFFEQRGVDWPAEVAKRRDQVKDGMGDDALWQVFDELISLLGDSHTKILGMVDGEPQRIQAGLGSTLPMIRNGIGEGAWVGGLVDQLVEDLLDPGAELIADRVVLGEIDGRIGYLQIFTMGGFSDAEVPGSIDWSKAELAALDRILDTAMTRFEGHDAVILDLSNNRGGYDAVTRAIAALFTDNAFIGYRVSVPGELESLTEYLIEPHDGRRFTGPVYLMTSDVTVSGGEITTLMLNALPNVTLVGTTTRGAFSTPLAKPLPNGWYLELSNEVFESADGDVFEGRGIPPDMGIEIYPEDDPIGGHAAAIRQIVELVGD
tara:strand:- start:2142 stop:3536 length:1395 start_codon:yes stop_codon:yes gene_type:complete